MSGEEQMRQVREMAAEYMRRTHRLVTGWMVRMADGCTVRRFGTSGSGRAPDLAMRLRELAAGRELITGVVNTTVLSVVDAALVPGLNEYYRLYQGQRPAEAERLREEAMAMLAHAVLKHPGS